MARPIIRAATGITMAKRIVLDDETIPDITSVAWDNPLKIDLLECTEAQAEATISDGSGVADTPLYSRIARMRFNFLLDSASACKVRWMLVKLPSGVDTIAALTGGLNDANFHGSVEGVSARDLRGNTLAKGFVSLAADRLQSSLRIFVSRAAMKRASPMKEDDKISLFLAKNAPGTTASISGFGTIWVKANG